MTGKMKRLGIMLGLVLMLGLLMGCIPAMAEGEENDPASPTDLKPVYTIKLNDIFYIGETIDFGEGVYCNGVTNNQEIRQLKGKQKISYEQYSTDQNKYLFHLGDYLLDILSENKGDPSGIKVASGDGTSTNPFTFEVVPHIHSFTYSASGSTITATCTAGHCPLKDGQGNYTSNVKLTIVKPTLTTSGEAGKSAAATLDGKDVFNTVTGKSVAETAIKYVGRDGTTYEESTTAPTVPGKYTAKITLSGVKTSEGDNKSVTASVDYSIMFTLTFNTNEGSSVSQQQLDVDEKTTRPQNDPTKAGKIFGDWYEDSSFDTKYTFGEALTKNTTVYAKWGDHEVRWMIGSDSIRDVFDGADAPAATSANSETEKRKPQGSTFIGWISEKDEKGNVTYTAQFSYPVTFHANDGTINAGSISSYIYGMGATLPTDVTRAGYTFNGWFDNSGLTGTAATQIRTTDTGAKEYWAKWTALPATAPTVTGANILELIYGYTDGSVNVTATAATDTSYRVTYQWYSNTTKSNSDGTVISNATSASYTIPTGKDAGTTEYYYCVVTATRTDNSQTATKVSDVATVTVGKADPIANAPAGLTATYGQTLAEVTLNNPTGNTEGTWTWVDATTTSVGDVGTNKFKANFTPTNANYKTIENVDVTVTVSKADSSDTPEMEHTPEVIPAVAATCTSTGKTEGSRCSVCGTILTAPVDTPVIPHTLILTPAVAATCEAAGNNAYWTCEVCGKHFGDEAGTAEIEQNSWLIAATGHAWGEPTYTWAEDNSTVTAARICGNDSSHVFSETVKTTFQKSEPTYEKAGRILYIAKFETPEFAMQMKELTLKQLVRPAVTGIKIDETDDEPLEIGDTLQLSAEILPEDAESELIWSSSDPDVATVDKDGLVTAVSKGKAVITVKTENGKAAKVTIQVAAPAAEKVLLDRTKTVKLTMGTTLKLNATVLPADSETALTWSSSSKKIAKVSDKGVVTPVKAGTVTITVTTENGLTAEVKIEVISKKKAVDAESLELAEKSVKVALGETVTLNAEVTPANATSLLSWSSSNEKIATVNNEGVVTPLQKGSVTITAATDNGLKASATVKIIAPKPTGISLEQSGTVKVILGETLQLTAALNPETAEAKLTWSSSKAKVATVSENGLVTPLKTGTTTITVTTDNKKKASVKISVVLPEAESVTLDRSETVRLRIGDTLQLSAEVAPSNAEKKLNWNSSDKQIATVTENGLVSAVSAGAATISVNTKNKKTDSLMVIVLDDKVQKVEAESISISGDETVKLVIGKTAKLAAVVAPANAEILLTWKSSKKEVATINNDGLITAKGKGTATITVTTDNGKTAMVKVSVSAPKPDQVELNETETVELELGDTLQLDAELKPTGAESTLTWSTSSKKIATVSKDGLVTPIKTGLVTITVKTANKKTASVKVNVIKPRATDILLKYGKKINRASMKVKKTIQLTAVVTPESAKPVLTWESSDETIATVTKDGKVTAKKTGKVKITVTTDNDLSASMTITVK